MDERIEKTIACKDCEYIPKVENAGYIEDGYQIMHNGLKIVVGCYHGDFMTEIISRCRGHHEPQEEKAFYEVLKHIKSGSVMVELGSFWAYYSMWFNKQIPNAKNYMIDIDDSTLNIGKTNFELNGLYGHFYVGRVPEFNIWKFMIDNQIDFIDILHFDIQGWEFHLLDSIKENLSKIGYLFISTHTDKTNLGHSWGSPRENLHEDCLEFLRKKNFVILCEHNMNESASHDGLIVAKNPIVDIDFNEIEISKLN